MRLHPWFLPDYFGSRFGRSRQFQDMTIRGPHFSTCWKTNFRFRMRDASISVYLESSHVSNFSLFYYSRWTHMHFKFKRSVQKVVKSQFCAIELLLNKSFNMFPQLYINKWFKISDFFWHDFRLSLDIILQSKQRKWVKFDWCYKQNTIWTWQLLALSLANSEW